MNNKENIPTNSVQTAPDKTGSQQQVSIQDNTSVSTSNEMSSSTSNAAYASNPTDTLADFLRKKKEINTPSPAMIKTCRIVSILFMLFAVGYLIMPYDFDRKGFVGYIDDFFVFMAAFTFLKSSFLKPEQKFMRRQFNMISLIMFCLALCWLILLAFLPA